MIKRKLTNTSDPDYPKGERQYEYGRQFLFREPMKSPMAWPKEVRQALVKLLRATQQQEAWEFLLKKKFDKEWYIARVYYHERPRKPRNLVVVMDSASINIFMALCSFYCIGYNKGVIEYTSDWFTEYEDKQISERFSSNGQVVASTTP